MRVKSSASFPHPILSLSTGDYGDRTFRLDLEVLEEAESGHAVLKGSMALDDSSVQGLLESGRAVCGLMITCFETYLDEFHPRPLGEFHVDLSGGRSRGTVYVRGAIVATEDGVSLDSEWINSEFPMHSRIARAGDLIALSEEHRFEAGLEKLAPLESIFHLKLHEDVAEGVFQINLDSESIDILVARDLHAFLSLLRGQRMKDTLLSSLFLPVVMSVLEEMRADDSYVDKRWYGIISARCSSEGIDFKNGNIADAAQRLLDSPLESLKNVFERAST